MSVPLPGYRQNYDIMLAASREMLSAAEDMSERLAGFTDRASLDEAVPVPPTAASLALLLAEPNIEVIGGMIAKSIKGPYRDASLGMGQFVQQTTGTVDGVRVGMRASAEEYRRREEANLDVLARVPDPPG